MNCTHCQEPLPAVVVYQGLYTGDGGSVSEFGARFAFVHTKARVLRAHEAVTEEYDVMLNSALNSLAKS